MAPSLAVRQGRVPQYYDVEADSRPLCDLLLFHVLHWRTDDAGAALFATTPRGSLSFSSLKFVEKLVACSCCVVNTLNLFDIIPMIKLTHSRFCSRAVQSPDLAFIRAGTRRSLWITVRVELGQFLCSCVSLLSLSIYLCSVHVEDPSNSPPLILYQQIIFTICSELQSESGSFMLYSLPA